MTSNMAEREASAVMLTQTMARLALQAAGPRRSRSCLMNRCFACHLLQTYMQQAFPTVVHIALHQSGVASMLLQ